MKVVIIGSDGFVGVSLIDYVKKQDYPVDIISIGKSFFTNSGLKDEQDISAIYDEIKSIAGLSKKPVYCVNLLSAANVDFCEANPDISRFVNFVFPKSLFRRLSNIENIRIISFSSNAVYGGKNAPYDELADFNPVNHYGDQKARLDDYVRNELDHCIIMRPTTLFGTPLLSCRSNPVFDLIGKARLKAKIKLVTDLTVNFGYVTDLCKAIIELIKENEETGEYNFGGPHSLSRFDLGNLIYEYYGAESTLIESCRLSDFNPTVNRPNDTTFVCDRFDNRFSFLRTSVKSYLQSQI